MIWTTIDENGQVHVHRNEFQFGGQGKERVMMTKSENDGMILAKLMVRDVVGWGKDWVQIVNAALREQRKEILKKMDSLLRANPQSDDWQKMWVELEMYLRAFEPGKEGEENENKV